MTNDIPIISHTALLDTYFLVGSDSLYKSASGMIPFSKTFSAIVVKAAHSVSLLWPLALQREQICWYMQFSRKQPARELKGKQTRRCCPGVLGKLRDGCLLKEEIQKGDVPDPLGVKIFKPEDAINSSLWSGRIRGLLGSYIICKPSNPPNVLQAKQIISA